MTFSFITIENLSNLIEQCTNDLRNNQSGRLFNLANVLSSIADCNDKAYLFVLPQCIGSFAIELKTSNSLITIPVLPENIRTTHSKTVQVATEQAIKSLDTIKIQLCVEDNPNFDMLINAVGVLLQQANILQNEKIQFSPQQIDNDVN